MDFGDGFANIRTANPGSRRLSPGVERDVRQDSEAAPVADNSTAALPRGRYRLPARNVAPYIPFSFRIASAFSEVTFSVGRTMAFSTFSPLRCLIAWRSPSAPGVA